MMKKAKGPEDGDRQVDARLQHVAQRFSDEPELPWMLAAASVIEAHKLLSMRVNSVLGEFDLTMARYEILGFLDTAVARRMSVKELKRSTLLHPPTMTYTLDWLETRGLVERRPSRTDRRSIDIVSTRKGRRLFDVASKALSEINFGLADVGRAKAEAITKALASSK